ncbi:MAG: hypothetical protein KDD70_18865, partial [Bdellovibrionales bacterium]|nr:hypothetical protein [Bdellovibrionales bacterium]
DLVKTLSTINGVQLGVLPTDGSTVFPGVFLQIASSEGDSSATTIKSKLSEVAAQQGLPATAWQKKDVDGVSVEYLLTPLGLGVFLASDGPNLMITSSENAIKRLITARKTNDQSLFAELPSEVQKSLTGSSPLLVAYFNAERGIDLLKSVESSFAMFTQGQELLPKEQLEDIRKMGTSYTLASYDKGLLNVSGLTVPASQQQH